MSSFEQLVIGNPISYLVRHKHNTAFLNLQDTDENSPIFAHLKIRPKMFSTFFPFVYDLFKIMVYHNNTGRWFVQNEEN